jgi:hypothetical protein
MIQHTPTKPNVPQTREGRRGGGGVARARICKCLRSPGIDSKESVPPTYVAWRARMSTKVVAPARQAGNQFLGSVKGLQIRALVGPLPIYTRTEN